MSAPALRTRALVALGSNLGDRRVQLEVALARLAAEPGVTALDVSSFHVTQPVGGPAGQAPYLNAVLRIETELDPRELLQRLQALERRAGRDRSREQKNDARCLDLDLLFHGDLSMRAPELELPHPRIEERSFVLAPLCELEPERVLRGCGRTVRQQLEQLNGQSKTSGRVFGETLCLHSPAAAQAWCRERAKRGESIGFVPTMGALHAGHLELARRAAAENDVLVVSVFVNPLQFNDPQDFQRYPRDFAGDARMLTGAGATMAFTGDLTQFFPGQVGADGKLASAAWIEPGSSAEGLEGRHRPGHFRGVSTIVRRLFDVVAPTRAYFGQKDFQQALVVQDLARARGGPQVIVCSTSREIPGLARSSRNQLLSDVERRRAASLFAGLCAARELWRGGERRAEALDACLKSTFGRLDIELEYAEVRDPEAWTAAPCRGKMERAIALLAARVGRTRLIDNLRLDEPGSGVR